MSERYFAYGSNLWIDQMIARTGPIRQGTNGPRVARLPNHRLTFNMHGGDGQVYANLMSPGLGVFGVVYSCAPESLAIMDAYENGYERRQVRVVLENGEEWNAATYFADASHEGVESQPSSEYLERILRGARQQGLPDAYLREIQSTGVSKGFV